MLGVRASEVELRGVKALGALGFRGVRGFRGFRGFRGVRGFRVLGAPPGADGRAVVLLKGAWDLATRVKA